ncbi:MAG: hypothetical protein D3925_06725 [Candidatus Electrothrix sp. AR5]|nr:hypothetical protein [Candidatus Electrothrix sp. AR5]
MEKSFKLEERKNSFVIGLFGFGGLSFLNDNLKQLLYLYYFIPFVTIAYDLLILSQKYTIKESRLLSS